MSNIPSGQYKKLAEQNQKLKSQLAQIEKSIQVEEEGMNEFASDAFKAAATRNRKLKYQLLHLEKAIGAEEKDMKPFSYSDDEHSSLDVYELIEKIMEVAVSVAFSDFAGSNPNITVPTVKNAGAYQCNAALAIANKLKKSGQKTNPREVANKIIACVPTNDIIKSMDIAGPGFINIHVEPSFMLKHVHKFLRQGVLPPHVQKKRVIVDFSSPNIAKEMHVGHLRSTIIGESLSRILEFCGHGVLRLNHVGDWGTQFGMLITNLQDQFPDYKTVSPPIQDLQQFYKQAKERFDNDAEFKKRAYQGTVDLQSGVPDVTTAWKLICDVSRQEFNKIYERLDISIEERGESFYHPLMKKLVEEMTEKGFLSEDEKNPGLKVAWTSAKEKTKIPMIVVKSDGAFTYSTSDLATIRHRLIDEEADWIVYVVGSSQDLHFQNLFAMATDIGWLYPHQRVDHVGFGDVLGEDGKKFKSRSGDTVKLRDLLDEGVARSKASLEAREANKDLSAEQAQKIYETVAYSCIKYADLSHCRTNDYVFSFDKMLQDKGNTAVYLLYAYARIQNILNNPAIAAKGVDLEKEAQTHNISIDHEREIKLCQHLMRLPELLNRLQRDLMPDRLCDYLYHLCTAFTAFYDKCYCVRKNKEGEVVEVNVDRLLLVRATGIVMHKLFFLLGIHPLDRMQISGGSQ